MKRQLRLGAFLMSSGHHVAAWRYPDARADGGLSFQHYRQIAQTAEWGKFDMIFFADGVGVRDRGGIEALSRSGHLVHFEPLTLLSALSVVTERIGLAATVSTTYNEPFHLARKFASLDHLSGGRAALNLVTSATEVEAQNFSREKHMEHTLRYERAMEFVDVLTALWDSWEDDAFLRDKESGVYFDSGQAAHSQPQRQAFFSARTA